MYATPVLTSRRSRQGSLLINETRSQRRVLSHITVHVIQYSHTIPVRLPCLVEHHSTLSIFVCVVFICGDDDDDDDDDVQ